MAEARERQAAYEKKRMTDDDETTPIEKLSAQPKQVIVIRRDLHMRRGKEIAQGAHASMAWLTQRITREPTGVEAQLPMFTPAENAWITGLFTKVVCQVNTEAELRDIYEKAIAAGLEAHLITDAGLTEFAGVATATAVGIGPDFAEKIDTVTAGLKLY